MCPAGYYSDGNTEQDHNKCTACVPGQYASNDGAANCKFCEVGAYTTTSKQSACSTCVAGKETNKKLETGGTNCVICAVGRHEKTNQCIDCPKGWNQIATMQSNCVECPIGRVASAEKTSIACALCHDGDYVNVPAQETCLKCGPGTFT